MTGLGFTLLAAGYLQSVVRTGRGGEKNGQSTTDDNTTMSQLSSSGTLKVQNATESAQQIDVRVDRTDDSEETTLFQLNSEMDPDDSVVAVGLLSDSGRYRVVAETSTDQQDEEWEVDQEGDPANVVVRVHEDGKLNVNVLFLH